MHKTHHFSIDYYAYRSGLGYWNTDYKAAFSVAALIIVIAADNLGISAVTILFMLFLSVGIGKLPLGEYLRMLRLPAAFLLLGAVAILIQVGRGEGSLFSIPFFGTKLFLTKESLYLAGRVVLKAFAAVSAFYMLTLSTPMGEIISVFRKLRVPNVILELMHLIYRYIFVLSDINQKQKEAAGSRLGYSSLRTSFRTFGAELANLLVLSLRRAELHYDAMESRGYEGSCLFWEEKRPLKKGQLVYGIIYIVMLAIIAAVRRWY
ncbi:cobalt/nickel transport system permease protein [Anaerotaenia torta]|uniref:cobalt ECF transporter T component CbiQ n=1 Tax=Anaerotaenia torta TaxID=433293 RepID=UPI003D24DD8D